VHVSVVGAERVPFEGRIDRRLFGYFEMKRKAELVVEGSGLPWTMLRPTQFHDLMLLVIEKMAKLPVVPVPAATRFQPVDTDEVAARVVELALGSPAGLVAELAGPRVSSFADLVRRYLEATHHRRPVLSISLPGTAARAVRAGAILPTAGYDAGTKTWEAYLAERVSQPAPVRRGAQPSGSF
jgi:uncharacterized protein YbjT (DUF2867 family)